MMRDKNLFITLAITSLIFSFVIFLIYLIYCYAYYDEHINEVYVDNFNNMEYRFVYDNMVKNDELEFEDFLIPIHLMYDKVNLTKIYNKYYRGTFGLEGFLAHYYYGINKIDIDDIKFNYEGKTGLINRRKTLYESIDVTSKMEYTSVIGVLSDITLEIGSNSSLQLDGEDLICNLECHIDYVFGGLHEIIYINNGIKYYGLLNLYKSDSSIDINNVLYLVKVE